MKAEGPITAPKPLVIGIGNRDRGDDAVGPMVADALRRAVGSDVEIQTARGDLSHLVLEWKPNQDVVIVDALVSHRDPGTVVETDALDQTLRLESALLSSHGVGVAETVELARLLHRLPRSLCVIAVEGTTFEHGAPISDQVVAVIPVVVEELASRLTSSHQGTT